MENEPRYLHLLPIGRQITLIGEAQKAIDAAKQLKDEAKIEKFKALKSKRVKRLNVLLKKHDLNLVAIETAE